MSHSYSSFATFAPCLDRRTHRPLRGCRTCRAEPPLTQKAVPSAEPPDLPMHDLHIHLHPFIPILWWLFEPLQQLGPCIHQVSPRCTRRQLFALSSLFSHVSDGVALLITQFQCAASSRVHESIWGLKFSLQSHQVSLKCRLTGCEIRHFRAPKQQHRLSTAFMELPLAVAYTALCLGIHRDGLRSVASSSDTRQHDGS